LTRETAFSLGHMGVILETSFTTEFHLSFIIAISIQYTELQCMLLSVFLSFSFFLNQIFFTFYVGSSSIENIIIELYQSSVFKTLHVQGILEMRLHLEYFQFQLRNKLAFQIQDHIQNAERFQIFEDQGTTSNLLD